MAESTIASPELRPHPASGIFPEMPPAEFRALVDDIDSNGLREPIVLYEGKILDGNHRYRACKELGITPRTKVWFGKGLPVDFVVSLNLKRRHLTPGQRTAAASAAMPFYRKKAKARMRAGGGDKKSGTAIVQDPIPEQGEAAEHVAKAFHTSPRSVYDYRAVEKSEPELAKQVAAGKTTLSKAKRQTKRNADREKAAKAPTIESVTKDTKFSCIMIDPPWDASDEGDVDQMGRTQPDYATMTIDKIRKLPVGKLADSNAHLYLWITNRSLPKGFDLMDAWGFRYITTLIWCKPSIGIGNYFRNNTEHVLFGVKGKLSLLRQDVGTWFEAPRSGPHSTKPDAFYDIVESCSPGPRLEMFARKPRVGWATWGASGVPVTSGDAAVAIGRIKSRAATLA